MQQCIQCCIHVQLVASSKAMLHLMINPEITILTALRLLLMSIAIIVDAVGAMKKGDYEQELDQGGDFALSVRILLHLSLCFFYLLCYVW
jgi:hypothetical protein